MREVRPELPLERLQLEWRAVALCSERGRRRGASGGHSIGEPEAEARALLQRMINRTTVDRAVHAVVATRLDAQLAASRPVPELAGSALKSVIKLFIRADGICGNRPLVCRNPRR